MIGKLKTWWQGLTHKTEAIVVIVALVAILAILYVGKVAGLELKPLNLAEVVEIISTLFVIAVFMERSVEASLIPIRTPDKQKIEQKLEIAEKLADAAEAEASAKAKAAKEAAKAKTEEAKKAADAFAEKNDNERIEATDRSKLEFDLAAYKLETAQRAYWLSYGFGLAISLVGVRVLPSVVETSSLEGLSDVHRAFFDFADVLLTGGAIGGGSAAIDKIGRRISEFFKLSSATDSKNPANPPPNQ